MANKMLTEMFTNLVKIQIRLQEKKTIIFETFLKNFRLIKTSSLKD